MSKARPKRRLRNRPQHPPPPSRPTTRRRPVAGSVRAIVRRLRQVLAWIRVRDHGQLARRFLISAYIWIVAFASLFSIALWQRFHPVQHVAMFDPLAGGSTAGNDWGLPLWPLLTTTIFLFGCGPVLLGNAVTRWISVTTQPATMAKRECHQVGFWTLWFAFLLTVGSLFLPWCSTQAGWQWNVPLILTGGPIPKSLTAEVPWLTGVFLAAAALEMVVFSQLAALFRFRSDRHDAANSDAAGWRLWLGALAIVAAVFPIVMAYAVSELYRHVAHMDCVPLTALNRGIAQTVVSSWLLGASMRHAFFGIAIVGLACSKSTTLSASTRTIDRNDSSLGTARSPRIAWWATLLLMAAILGTIVANSLTALPAIQPTAMQIAWACEATALLVGLMLAFVLKTWNRSAHSQRLAWVITLLLFVVAAANHLGVVRNAWILTLVPTSARLVAWSATVALAASLSTTRMASRQAVYTSRATLYRIALITCVLIFIQLNLGSLVHQMPITASHGAMRSVFVFHLVVASAIIVHEAWLLPVVGWQFLRRFSIIFPVLLLVGLTAIQMLLGMMMWVVQFGWTSWLGNYHFAAAYTVRAARVLPVLVTTSHLVIGYSILAVAVTLLLRIAHLQKHPL